MSDIEQRSDDYQIPREKFMDTYIENAVSLLKATMPEEDEDLLRKFVIKQVHKRYKPLNMEVVINKNYGSAELVKNIDALKFFNYYNQHILSPSGSVYYTVKKKTSVMRDFVKYFVDTRKVLKKEMLKAEERGDTVIAEIKNYGQSTMKIRANSIIGGMGSEFSFCYNKAAFNSVTSLSRNTTMTAYAYTERFLVGNFYFPTFDHTLNYLAVMMRSMPNEKIILDIVEKYNLYIPDPYDLTNLFISYMEVYTDKIDRVRWNLLMHNLTEPQRIFLYYANNFFLLAYQNREVLLKLSKQVFDDSTIDFSNLESIDPNDLFKYDGDLMIVLNTHYAYLLNKMPLYDTPKKVPDIARKLCKIADYMTNAVVPLMEIMSVFCNNHTSIAGIIAHKQMYRKAVANSDTDSVIFTTKEWVKWYTGSYNFTQDAFDMDVLITFLLSKSIAWLMYTISAQRGAIGDDLKLLKMKNEFLYPVMMSCIIPKHYVGPITIREGVVLPEPQLDIKGVSFRGSSLQKVTLDNTTKFLTDIINQVYDKEHPERIGQISLREEILKVIKYESFILNSLRRGEVSYLNVDPVRPKEEYKTPDSSIYFNYQIWCEVFAKKYGEIQIPTKCHIVPLISSGFHTNEYKEFLHKNYPDIFEKLMAYISKIGKKEITRMPLSPLLDHIPPELMPLLDAKSIVYKNCAPMYLALESLGLSSGISSNKKMCFIDLFGVSEDTIYEEETDCKV